jgi:hypothetical protein
MIAPTHRKAGVKLERAPPVSLDIVSLTFLCKDSDFPHLDARKTAAWPPPGLKPGRRQQLREFAGWRITPAAPGISLAADPLLTGVA